jgi:hypothetical protein
MKIEVRVDTRLHKLFVHRYTDDGLMIAGSGEYDYGIDYVTNEIYQDITDCLKEFLKQPLSNHQIEG